MTVAEHLAASRNAHKAYRVASGVIDPQGKIKTPANYPAARAAVEKALQHRVAADVLDPGHTDAAWMLELSATHADLVKFYENYLSTP